MSGVLRTEEHGRSGLLESTGGLESTEGLECWKVGGGVEWWRAQNYRTTEVVLSWRAQEEWSVGEYRRNGVLESTG